MAHTIKVADLELLLRDDDTYLVTKRMDRLPLYVVRGNGESPWDNTQDTLNRAFYNNMLQEIESLLIRMNNHGIDIGTEEMSRVVNAHLHSKALDLRIDTSLPEYQEPPPPPNHYALVEISETGERETKWEFPDSRSAYSMYHHQWWKSQQDGKRLIMTLTELGRKEREIDIRFPPGEGAATHARKRYEKFRASFTGDRYEAHIVTDLGMPGQKHYLRSTLDSHRGVQIDFAPMWNRYYVKWGFEVWLEYKNLYLMNKWFT